MITLDELRTAGASSVLFECIAGSRAYGTSTTASDEDIRGIFAVPAASYMDLVRPPDQISDERGNIAYYSLRRIVDLLAQANPNILQLLFMPEDCVLKSSPEMKSLVAHRDLFISKQCADTHAGYAMSQIRKAKGQNKWVNNPRPPAPPEKEDYCYIVPWNGAELSGSYRLPVFSISSVVAAAAGRLILRSLRRRSARRAHSRS
jgi:predicted nucleotidyltransferase